MEGEIYPLIVVAEGRELIEDQNRGLTELTPRKEIMCEMGEKSKTFMSRTT